MGRLLRRLWYLLRTRRAAADLSDELTLHRALLEDEARREGRAAGDASFAAARRLGSRALAADELRDAVVPPVMGDVLQDVRFALRLLAKDRRFTAAAVIALGLGIGVTGSVFTLVNAALIRDLPFEDADRLVSIDIVAGNGRTLPLTRDEYVAWNAAVESLDGIGVTAHGVMNVSDEGRPPERLRGTFISENTLALLRSEPVLGRAFRPADARPGAPPVVLLGHGVWKARYGSDPSIVGRAIRLNHVPTVVIGVMPDGFRFPFVTEAWQLLSASPEVARAPGDARLLRGAFGRLADGVPEARAEQELTAAAARIVSASADRPGAVRVAIAPLKQRYTQGAKAGLLTFLGAVVVVLLVACANVANLLLTRAATRSREMAVRASLGATRWRLVRQLLVECLVLALLGGVLGMALARYGAGALAVAFSPIEPGVVIGELRPFWLDLSFDGSMLAFAGMACLAASLVFGLVPALHVARTDLTAVMKDGERGSGSHRARRWTSAFVVAEVALTLVLMAAAGLLWRSFYAHYTRDLGIDTSGIVSMRLTVSGEHYDSPDRRRVFVSRLQEALETAPGFDAVALTASMPFTFGAPSRHLTLEGRPAPAGAPPLTVSYIAVGARYFDVLRLPLRRGRAFADRAGGGPAEAVIDERFAATFFPGRDPIGSRIRLDRPTTSTPAPPPGGESWLTIVGIAPTLGAARPAAESPPAVYVSLGEDAAPATTLSILAQSRLGAGAAVAALRERVRALDDDLPLYGVETLETVVALGRAPQRLLGHWFAIIAAIALVLAAVGIWGVTAHGVAQRTREVGIRMALGAHTSQIVWLFARSTSVLLAIGLLLGVAGALLAGPLLRAFLVQTDARDPLTLLVVAVALSSVAIAASLVPARRASRLDPVTALRRD